MLLDDSNLEQDLEQALNLSELCRRRFPALLRWQDCWCRVSRQNKPGQLQISGSLLWEVFNKHEPNNLLVRQAQHEVLRATEPAPRADVAAILHCPTRWAFGVSLAGGTTEQPHEQ